MNINEVNAYMERQNSLNKDLDKKEILDSIDRPIRPLVIEFNRIGLQTKYSCCGFNYDGEEEPKTHTRHAYIFFYEPTTEIGKQNLELVKKVAIEKFGWQFFRHCFNDTKKRVEYNLHSELLPGHKELYIKNDQIPTAIHDYEIHVIRIQELYDFCKILPTDLTINQNDEVIIEDGNKVQVERYPEWQIKPKKNSKFCLKDVPMPFPTYSWVDGNKLKENNK